MKHGPILHHRLDHIHGKFKRPLPRAARPGTSTKNPSLLSSILQSLRILPGNAIRIHQHLLRHPPESGQPPRQLVRDGVIICLERDPLQSFIFTGPLQNDVVLGHYYHLPLPDLAVEHGLAGVADHLEPAIASGDVNYRVGVHVPVRRQYRVLHVRTPFSALRRSHWRTGSFWLLSVLMRPPRGLYMSARLGESIFTFNSAVHRVSSRPFAGYCPLLRISSSSSSGQAGWLHFQYQGGQQ